MQTDRQTGRQTDGQTDRQKDRLQNIYQYCIVLFLYSKYSMYVSYPHMVLNTLYYKGGGLGVGVGEGGKRRGIQIFYAMYCL